MTERLDKPLQTTLSALGAGTVSRSVPWGQRWNVTAVSTVAASTSTPYPVCSVYRGIASDSNLIAATFTGNRDVAGGAELFFSGETVTVTWNGGVASTQVTAHVMGEILRS